MIISLIAAISENGVIGKDGGIPWRLSEDLKLFKRVTMGHHLIVGRKTYESIGKPLPGRTMVVLTRQENYKAEGCTVVHSLPEALDLARDAGDDEVFIGGGAALYALALPLADRLYISRVHAEVNGDTYFPDFDQDNWQVELSHRYPAGDKQQYDFTYSILVPEKNEKKR